MYAIVPGVATLGAAALLTLFAVHQTAPRRQAGRAAAMAAGRASWAASEPSRPRPQLVVTRFERDPPLRPPTGPEPHATVRLDRLREALDQLTGLLLVGAAGEHGQARFLASLGGGEHPIDLKIAASALAMRRLGTLMLSSEGGEAFLVARSAVRGRAGAQGDTRAIWEDFLAALAFLTGACQRRRSTIHLEEVEAAALSVEHLCQALSRTELVAARLRAGRALEGC